MAGCGQGEDGAKLDDAERARLRQQAHDWVQADVAAWRRLPDESVARICRFGQLTLLKFTLLRWQDEADFAGVRGEALAKLPEAERKAWQQLWADVEQTLLKTKPVIEKHLEDRARRAGKLAADHPGDSHYPWAQAHAFRQLASHLESEGRVRRSREGVSAGPSPYWRNWRRSGPKDINTARLSLRPCGTWPHY